MIDTIMGSNERGEDMKAGTYAVYTISVSPPTHTMLDVLKQAIPSHMAIETNAAWFVPRLCTYWKGDTEEQAWQDTLRGKVHIEVAEWTPAPGYPQGDLEL